MPVNIAALKTELANDPQSLGYAPLVAIGNDTGLCNLLNAENQSFSVSLPTVEWWVVNLWFAQNGRYLALLTASQYSGADLTALGLKNAALVALQLFNSFGAKDPFDTQDADLQTMLTAFVTAGILTSADKTAFDALNVRSPASRAEVLFGANVKVIEHDIVVARES